MKHSFTQLKCRKKAIFFNSLILRKILFSLSILIVYMFAWKLQTNLFTNWDVTYLLQASHRLLQGGTYLVDYFNPNPPLILYLYAIPLLLSQVFSVNLFILFRVSIFILASFSILLSLLVAQKILSLHAKIIKPLFILMLSIVFLILPLYEFGQREHILTLCLFPYLLLTISRLQFSPNHSQSSAFFLQWLYGLLAGIGIAIKPHYLLIILFIESYNCYQTKNYVSWIRIDLLTILAIQVLHLTAIYYLHPDYLWIILPQVLHLYHSAVGTSLFNLFFHPFFIFFYLISLLYFLINKNEQKIIFDVLFLTVLSFLITYFVQGTTYYYHFLPGFSFGLILLFFISVDFIEKNKSAKKEALFKFFLILLIIVSSTYMWFRIYQVKRSEHQAAQTLITFLQKNAHGKPIAFYTSEAWLPLLATQEAGAHFAQRFDCLWMIAALTRMKEKKREIFFVKLIADDLSKRHPQFVLVDTRAFKTYIDGKFEYLPFFLTHAAFKREWQHYQKMIEIHQSGLYQFEVYRRV